MRIDGQAPPYVVNITRTQQPSEPVQSGQQGAVPAKPASQERVVISPHMREIDRLKQEMTAIPEVRPDKVALAKQQMQYGSYRVDSALVAQRLMDSMPKG